MAAEPLGNPRPESIEGRRRSEVVVAEDADVLLDLEAASAQTPKLAPGRASAPAIIGGELLMPAAPGTLVLDPQQKPLRDRFGKQAVEKEDGVVERGEVVHRPAAPVEQGADGPVKGGGVGDMLGDRLADDQIEPAEPIEWVLRDVGHHLLEAGRGLLELGGGDVKHD